MLVEHSEHGKVLLTTEPSPVPPPLRSLVVGNEAALETQRFLPQYSSG